ncbi:MAG: metal-sensing transcriptional repressor [Candidatus Fimimonas sp.]
MQADKKQIIRLLNTARGQIDGIINMVESDRYCIDVSNQILASQAVLTRANKEILQAHIFNCVLNAVNDDCCCADEEAQKANLKTKLEEISALLNKLM